MVLNFGALSLFRDIVQNRSVSRGAALNGISQSAASQNLQEMEKEFGVTLLDRSTRPLTVTPAGRLYYEFCRDLLRRKGQFDVDLEKLKGQEGRTVRVATIYSIGISEMSGLEAEFRRRYPQAQLLVDYLRPEKIYASVLSDRVDLGLVSYPEPTREIAVIPWRNEVMVVAVAPSHPLAGQVSVTPGELNGMGFIAFDEELPIRRDVDRFLREHGVDVRITLHFDNIQSMKEAIALGQGISILPERVLQKDMEQGRLVAVSLDGQLCRPLGIIHHRRKKFHQAAQALLELLQEVPVQDPVPAQ
ncbi:MAG: LysR family transcriptional regulator [Bryobacteraceae bacterium]